ncbi:MAG: SSS family transporter [Saprospiraceae bacterium]|jgi:SSS family transporter
MNESLNSGIILGVIIFYFLLLVGISFLTGKDSGNENFFLAGRKSPWYIVAFGMIGASLSGVTFISVPGWVAGSQFSYMQMVLGYLVGYFVIATVLMPIYYRLQLTSIYTYLEQRLGLYSYKTGAGFFLLSRTFGASARLFLVALVLQEFVMGIYGIPFWATVLVTIVLIWVYTFRGGIKTIVWTDTLQTFCMLLAVVFTVIAISQKLNLDFVGVFEAVKNSKYSQVFFFKEGWTEKINFFKYFFGGAAIAIAMTGLDQDMMQKNLSCKNIGEAQKNMLWFSIALVFANLLFLTLGALLFIFIGEVGIEIPTRMVNGEMKEATDLLYPTIAFYHLSPAIQVIFVLGLIAAAYSSADSALTSLTTSFCVDFLGFEKKQEDEQVQKKKRFFVHLAFSFLLFLMIMAFYGYADRSVIQLIFEIASYTYGPLLGLYAFGFLTTRPVIDKYVPIVCILSPVLSFFINRYSETLFFGYKFSFELLIVNGLLTFIGLLILSSYTPKEKIT